MGPVREQVGDGDRHDTGIVAESGSSIGGFLAPDYAYPRRSRQARLCPHCQSQQALALAQAFPDLKGIIVPAGIGLPAAARALEQAGALDKIKLTGVAPATLMKKYIEAGQAQDIWWNVTDLGYLTYHVAQLIAQCKINGNRGETFVAVI